MKKTTAAQIAIIAALCVVLSGCALGSSGKSPKKPISVSYEDMFKPKTDSAKTETVTGQANAAAPDEAPAEEAPAALDSGNPASPANSAKSASENKTEIKSKTAEAQSPTQSAASVQSSSQTAAAQKAAPAARASGNTSSAASEYTEPIRMPTGANATGKDPAAVALGGVCYLPHKVPEPAVEESKPTTDSNTSDTSDTTSNSYKKPVKEPTKYDYGYRVVFRTSSETYLMSVTPYKTCTWDDLNRVCAEIGEKLETECEVVGAPSQEDLKMFTEAGIYFPEKHEFWTSTLTAEKGHKAYYRSSNGTFNSTKSTSLTSGACVIVKVKTSQSNAELLSNSRPNFDALKAQLEKEAATFKEAQNKSNSNANNSQ